MSEKSLVNAGSVMGAASAELPADGSAAIDRRAFLGTVGAAAGALVAASVVPLSVARGGELGTREQPIPAAGMTADCGEEDWHVDDICGHRPRYAHPIPHGPARSSPVLWEYVDPIDRTLVI